MNLSIVEARLRREHGLPANFHFFRYEMLPKYGKPIYCELEGGVCGLVSRGPRKGRPNYAKAIDKRMFAVTPSQAEQWELEWVQETGGCANCMAKGRTFKRWTKDGGTEWQECPRCHGSGRYTAGEAVSI